MRAVDEIIYRIEKLSIDMEFGSDWVFCKDYSVRQIGRILRNRRFIMFMEHNDCAMVIRYNRFLVDRPSIILTISSNRGFHAE